MNLSEAHVENESKNPQAPKLLPYKHLELHLHEPLSKVESLCPTNMDEYSRYNIVKLKCHEQLAKVIQTDDTDWIHWIGSSKSSKKSTNSGFIPEFCTFISLIEAASNKHDQDHHYSE